MFRPGPVRRLSPELDDTSLCGPASFPMSDGAESSRYLLGRSRSAAGCFRYRTPSIFRAACAVGCGKGDFEVTVNRDFARCRGGPAPNRPENMDIRPNIYDTYMAPACQWANGQSVEVWMEGAVVGGVFRRDAGGGVPWRRNRMFSRRTGCPKIALVQSESAAAQRRFQLFEYAITRPNTSSAFGGGSKLPRRRVIRTPVADRGHQPPRISSHATAADPLKIVVHNPPGGLPGRWIRVFVCWTKPGIEGRFWRWRRMTEET